MNIHIIDNNNENYWYNIEDKDNNIPKVGDTIRVESNYSSDIIVYAVVRIEHCYDKIDSAYFDGHSVNIYVSEV